MNTESNSNEILPSVRQGDHGYWAVYVGTARVSRFYATRQDAIFLGVREYERRASKR